MKIYIVGIGCVGKTTIGKLLVELIDYNFYNLDEEVERFYNKPIEKLQQEFGSIGYFSSQLSLIDRELRNSSFIELDKDNPPEVFIETEVLRKLGLSHIENRQKECGYSSIHYMARLNESFIPLEKRPVFEIQVRTLAQELWCELEHVLSYKPETRPHFSAKRIFQILSRQVSVIDEHFNLLYEELIHNQKIITHKDSDILTFENTPKVFSEIGIQCALTELNPILKTLFSRGIKTVVAF